MKVKHGIKYTGKAYIRHSPSSPFLADKYPDLLTKSHNIPTITSVKPGEPMTLASPYYQQPTTLGRMKIQPAHIQQSHHPPIHQLLLDSIPSCSELIARYGPKSARPRISSIQLPTKQRVYTHPTRAMPSTIVYLARQLSSQTKRTKGTRVPGSSKPTIELSRQQKTGRRRILGVDKGLPQLLHHDRSREASIQ